MMKRYLLLTIALLAICLSHADTLRLMHYNLMQYSNNYSGCVSDFTAKDAALRTVIAYIQPDIITVNEIGNTMSYPRRFLDSCLNIQGNNNWGMGDLTSASGGSSNTLANMIFYNREKLTMHSSYYVANSVRDFNVYRLYYNQTDLSKGDTAFLVVIVGHLKSGEAYAEARGQQVNALMARLNTIGVADNYILCGDLNLYQASEVAYQTLLYHANTLIRFYDPINKYGTWHDQTDFSAYHTQSTHKYSENCFSSGGLDDRFDFILVSESVLKGYDKVKALTNTYHAVGQDGQRFNQSVTDGTNYAVSATMAQALYNASDHLPVVMDFEVENILSVADAANKIPWQVQVVNPIEHSLTLQLQSTENQSYHVEIVSMIGQVLYQKSIPASIGSQTYSFNLPSLSTGMYILRVYNNQGQVIKKIMKQ